MGACQLTEECEQGIVPIGEPFDDMQSLIVDEQLREVEPGSNGELLTTGPQLSLGYWQDKEKTRLAFVQIVKKLLKIGLTRCDPAREPQGFDDSVITLCSAASQMRFIVAGITAHPLLYGRVLAL